MAKKETLHRQTQVSKLQVLIHTTMTTTTLINSKTSSISKAKHVISSYTHPSHRPTAKSRARWMEVVRT